MLVITGPLMTPFFILIAIFGTFIHAETEDEFIARVTAAWESKDPVKLLALYGDPQKLDPEFVKSKHASLELELKTCRIKSVHIIPFLPRANNPIIAQGFILQFPASVTKCVSEELRSEDPAQSSTWSITPIVQNKDGKYAYAAPTKWPFEWNGEKMSQFTIRMRHEGSEQPCSNTIAVIESCGLTTWEMIGGTMGVLGAHRILQLIVPPTFEAKSITFEISKDDAEPFFKKTIDTSKGVIVPIESKTP